MNIRVSNGKHDVAVPTGIPTGIVPTGIAVPTGTGNVAVPTGTTGIPTGTTGNMGTSPRGHHVNRSVANRKCGVAVPTGMPARRS